MSTDEKSRPAKKDRPGPKPETVKIDGNWEDAVKRALKTKRPTDWPEKPKKKPT